jgi:hypothetical protein
MNTATHTNVPNGDACMTRNNGCHNRGPYATRQIVQAGWWMDGVTRVARMESIPARMAKDCQYTLSKLGQADQGCTGCRHKQDLHKGIKYE